MPARRRRPVRGGEKGARHRRCLQRLSKIVRFQVITHHAPHPRQAPRPAQPPAAQAGALVPLVAGMAGEVGAAIAACAARGGPVALLQAACLALIAALLARLEAMIQDWLAGRLPGLPPPRRRPETAPRPRMPATPATASPGAGLPGLASARLHSVPARPDSARDQAGDPLPARVPFPNAMPPGLGRAMPRRQPTAPGPAVRRPAAPAATAPCGAAGHAPAHPRAAMRVPLPWLRGCPEPIAFQKPAFPALPRRALFISM